MAPFTDGLLHHSPRFSVKLLDRAITDLACSSDRFDGRLNRFHDVLIPDMSVVTLYQSLADAYRAPETITWGETPRR